MVHKKGLSDNKLSSIVSVSSPSVLISTKSSGLSAGSGKRHLISDGVSLSTSEEGGMCYGVSF